MQYGASGPPEDILEDDDQSPDISVPDPITVVEGLSLSDIHEVEADITSYHTLETNSTYPASPAAARGSG